MATNYEVREFQRSTNAWTSHHVKDLLGPVHVDSVLGPSSIKVGLRAARYFGIGLPTVREWSKPGHFNDQVVAELTDWFRSPSHFYSTHRFAKAAGVLLIAQERAKRVVRPKNGLLDFDGAHVAAWIHPILMEARKRGWQGTIPDKTYGGFRTYGQQNTLYQDYVNGGGIAASPSLPSNHQRKEWPGGAADCSDYDRLDRILRGMGNGSDLGRQGSSPSDDPVHFSSATNFRNTGHY